MFSSQTYVLSREDCFNVWMVDCVDVERLPGDVRVAGVLLTHAHFDHIYGLNRLVERFPEVRVVTNGFGVRALREPRLNISAYHSEFEDFVLNDSAKVEVVQEGDAYDVLGEVVRVFETPGHDPSCLCFEVDGRLFTGDAFIPGVRVFTGFPMGDRGLAAASVERILGLSEGVVVCAGHEGLARGSLSSNSSPEGKEGEGTDF